MITDTITDNAELVKFLLDPRSYPHGPASVELRETHISWVFLADRLAFKLKKPVRFDFLDFSTRELRKTACDAEVRLNRRMSPSVYLGLDSIHRNERGQLNLKGDGQVVDWLVKMRRLDDDRSLLWLLSTDDSGDISDRLRSMATHLANFYSGQAPLTVRPQVFRDHIQHHIEDNERQLLRIVSDEVDTTATNRVRLIHRAQKRFLLTHQDLFDSRVLDGRVVDGHGDLRPEHIYLYKDPLVIDCIEFNDEYRQNDIVDELGFLAMECDLLHEEQVGELLFLVYEGASNDRPDEKLIAFYKAYRACVRAKVAALRSEQQAGGLASTSIQTEHDYLDLAERYTRQLDTPLLVLVGGLVGTGKSTLARELGNWLAAEVISSDVVRKNGGGEAPVTAPQRAFGEGKYSAESRLHIYEAMLELAKAAFSRSGAVILDATFINQKTRTLAAELSTRLNAQLIQVECECPREEAMERIAERYRRGESLSEARPEFYDRLSAEAEPPLDGHPLVTIDTTLALNQQVADVLDLIRSHIHKI